MRLLLAEDERDLADALEAMLKTQQLLSGCSKQRTRCIRLSNVR